MKRIAEEIIFEQRKYKSVTKLCAEYSFPINTFLRRRRKGLTIRQCLGLDEISSRHEVTFEGQVFKSHSAFLKHYGVPGNTYWERQQRGLTMRQCLGLDPYRQTYAHWRTLGFCNEDGIEIEKAHYYLYEITNHVNGKIYIGITVRDLDVRWKQHLNDGLTKKSPLYYAMRKHGREHFKIQVIRDDAKSSSELMQQEIDEIKARRSTDPNIGYNIASGGSKGNSKPLVIDGQVFPSRSEAAAHFDIDFFVFVARLRDGFTPEHAAGLERMPNLRGHRVIVNGKEMNMMDAVNLLGKNYRCVNTRIRRGWTYRQAFDFDPPPPRLGRNRRPPIIPDDNARILS